MLPALLLHFVQQFANLGQFGSRRFFRREGLQNKLLGRAAKRALESYVESGYLVVSSDGRYRRADAALVLAAGTG